ncbi:MAG: sporulation protein YqfD, partial [Clostridia bacterium]|nr:sporulation protein YqfD [Clostridia bacterium]
MLKRIRNYLCGWREITICADQLRAAFDLIYKNELSFASERLGEDGSVTFTMREKDCRRFFAITEEVGITYESSQLFGLPVTLGFLRRRPMIPLGIFLLLGWLFYSENLVWDIRIEGNTKTETAEIVNYLEELGFGVGTYYPSVNFNQLHANYVAGQDDIAWLSVYMHGTVAEVQVKEMYKDERVKPGENTYANVVATSAGVVESLNVYEGQAAVRPGDIVVPGQVLISG